MSNPAQNSSGEDAAWDSRSRSFPTTLWAVVLDAGKPGADGANEALVKLCREYWYPLYAFVRRRGYSAQDAEDLTQTFFTHLLEKHGLGKVDREKGRFRTYLLASIK